MSVDEDSALALREAFPPDLACARRWSSSGVDVGCGGGTEKCQRGESNEMQTDQHTGNLQRGLGRWGIERFQERLVVRICDVSGEAGEPGEPGEVLFLGRTNVVTHDSPSSIVPCLASTLTFVFSGVFCKGAYSTTAWYSAPTKDQRRDKACGLRAPRSPVLDRKTCPSNPR
jgi:hypothetical protein